MKLNDWCPVAKSSSLATMNWLMSAHLMVVLIMWKELKQIYVEAKEPFWKKKDKKALPLLCWDSEFSLL